MKKHWIGLLDCNNFFVSCERLFRPDLLGKPVIVLSSNDGCAVARSQEVKDIGIPMGVPYFKIKDIIKKHDITTFSSHLTLYRDISRRVFNVMREELGEVDQYSVDEAFFKLDKLSDDVAVRLKELVQNRVGIPVSIGIGRTKTLAKYANTIAKKGDGVYRITDAIWQQINPEIPVQKIWGVGGGLELRFKENNIRMVSDLLESDPARIGRIFGQNGLRLQNELNGIPCDNLQIEPVQQQSIMSSRSFKDTTTDYSVVADSLAYHVRHTAADLRRMGQTAGSIRVSLGTSRHSDFFMRGGSKLIVFNQPTNDTIELLQAANKVLKEIFETDVPYKKTGVTMSELQSDTISQTQLFDTGTHEKNKDLMATVDLLNRKGKKELIKFGSYKLDSGWQSKRQSCSPRYTTAWSEVVVANAR